MLTDTRRILAGLVAVVGSSVSLGVPCALGAATVTAAESFGRSTPMAVLDSDSLSRAAALSVSLATITTDTGAFAPGDHNFVHYTTPGWCLAAAIQRGNVLRGRLAAQAVLDTVTNPQQDTIGVSEVTAVARTCGARFTVASTMVRDLPDLLELALLEQNDTLARTVLARQVALATTSAVQDSLRLAAVHMALGQLLMVTVPVRMSLLESIVADLDALGPSAQVVQLAGHVALLGLWVRSASVHRIQQEATRITMLAHARLVTASSDSAVGAALLTAYRARMALAFFAYPDSLQTIAHEAQADTALASVLDDTTVGHRSLGAVIARLAPVDTSGSTDDAIGHPTPWLRADYWFPTSRGAGGGRATRSDTVQPVRGRVSLFILVRVNGVECVEGGIVGCFAPIAARIRRWLAQDSAVGLSVTIVGETEGGTVLLGYLTPAEEAERLRWLVQDYWHLPVTVAVQVNRKDPPLPPPDGRIGFTQVAQIEKWARHIGQDQDGIIFLTGRDGKLLTITADYLDSDEAAARFDALLRWALRPFPTAQASQPVVSSPQTAAAVRSRSLPSHE